jgi:hypothetical protein
MLPYAIAVPSRPCAAFPAARSLIVLAISASVAFAAPLAAQAPARLDDSTFAALVARLSEPSGYFDTDNLISNEDSYLHVIGTLRRLGVRGGAYLGVGPDQNYSYIAAVRPRVAFIVDIRRDNLLQHLLFKALFSLSRNRTEYLSALFGKAAPRDTAGWSTRSVGAIFDYVATAPGATAGAADIRARVLLELRRSAIPLSAQDLATIARFHDAFIAQGPALRFNTFGRAPQPYYPDFRRLALETDLDGRQSSYLAREDDFRAVKSLHAANLIVPVIGDFAGTHALAGVAAWLRQHNETVSAFYTSNVEQYLFRDGGFTRFAGSVAALPRTARTVMIRSYFRGGHPQAVAGYHAVQIAQAMERFVATQAAGGFPSYASLVTTHLLPR